MSNQEAIRELLDLLPQIFDPDGLRRWLPSVPDGDRIAHNLPGGHVPSAQFFFSAADIFRRWGLLNVPEFWDPLERTSPFGIHKQVVALRAKFGVPPANPPIEPRRPAPTPTVQPTVAPAASASPPPPPQKITVLLVSASPDSRVRIRVDTEFRNITAKMRSTELRGRFEFIQLQAARFDDLRTALLLYRPHVLHISCHGEADGSLRFEESDTSNGVVAKSTLIKLLRALRDNLRLVVVNACHSQEIVRDIPPNIGLAIGMSNRVKDSDAMKFATAFYEALGYGRPVENAFEIASVDLSDDVVQLFPVDDPKRQLILVAP